MTKNYNCKVEDKRHKILVGATFDTEAKAMDFIQKVNNNCEEAHFFTVEEVEQDGSNLIIRSILKNATYIDTTFDDGGDAA